MDEQQRREYAADVLDMLDRGELARNQAVEELHTVGVYGITDARGLTGQVER